MNAKVRTKVRIPLPDSEEATFISFFNLSDGRDHFAIAVNAEHTAVPVLRIHSECVTGDVFGSMRCDCGPQLRESIDLISKQGGLILYLRQEGRGIGLYSKLDAYLLQDRGHDTYEANEALDLPADARNYSAAAEMLCALGVERVRLLTNNPDKRRFLESAGIEVVTQIATGVFANEFNLVYLEAKKRKGHHRLDIDQARDRSFNSRLSLSWPATAAQTRVEY